MSEQNKKDFKEKIPTIIIIVIVALIVIFLMMLLFSQKTTIETKKPGAEEKISSINCTTKSIGKHELYYSERALSSEYEVRGIFNGDRLRNLTFDFTSRYASAEIAKDAEFWIHANYNMKWQDWGFSADPLQANFTILSDNTVISRVYADYNQLTDKTASLVLIRADNGSIPSTQKDIKANYEKLGFTCTIKEDQ